MQPQDPQPPPLPILAPPALQKGDTIAFISPSSRLNHVFRSRIQNATQFFTSHGFSTTEIFSPIPTPSSSSSSSSSSKKPSRNEQVQHRISELHSAFSDPCVSAIICTIGGLTANELLPHLDYALIRANPKIFVGYSDTTLLHHAFYFRSGLRTFYGPAVIPQFGEEGEEGPVGFTVRAFLDVVMGLGRSVSSSLSSSLASAGRNDAKGLSEAASSSVRRYTFPHSETHIPGYVDWASPCAHHRRDARHSVPNPPLKWLRRPSASSSAQPATGTADIRGLLYGGCLPSLVQLTGTPNLPSTFYSSSATDPKVLFIELPDGYAGPASPFPPDLARTALFDLVNAGVLNCNLQCLIVGKMFQYDEEMQERFLGDVLEATSFVAPLDREEGKTASGMKEVPVLIGWDVGHVDPILTVPLGAKVGIDGVTGEVWVEEDMVAVGDR